jgi:glycosyltransferase involved in cell wall biosynthesis
MNKILQIGIEVNSGSTGRIAEQIGVVAVKSGFESYITYARGYNPSLSNTIKIGNKLSQFIHLLKTRVLGEHLNGSYFATKILINKINKLNPDIIHLHQIHGYYINVPLLFKFLKKFGKPVIWTLHDCWAFTGHCTHFSIEGCEKWKKECFSCPKRKYYPKSLFFDKSKYEFLIKKVLLNSIENITYVGVSDWIRSLAKQSFFGFKEIISIYNGVDTNIFNPKHDFENLYIKYNLNRNKIIILAVGTTWNSTKGFFDYLKLSENLNSNYQIVLVGVSKKEATLLPSNIIGIPRTENVLELAELYSASQLLLCLSYQESFGLTPIESMACGTPVVVYDNTALPELVNDSVGRVVKTGDISKVIQAIKEITQIGKENFKNQCIYHVKSKYSIDVTYENYINLYKELLKKY